MLGWIPNTKEFPFTHNVAFAYLDVLELSGIVSSYEYEMNNSAMVFTTPLLCKPSALVNDHALTKSISDLFQKTGNGNDKEVQNLLKEMMKNGSNDKIELYTSMNLFIECWYAVVGRFKAAWKDEDDVPPSSPAVKEITPG